MNRLNYHHLQYFWLVAKEHSLARASARLRLAPSTLSGQIHAFERVLGQQLFARVGRRLELTDVGRLVYRYADDIFTLGTEMQDAILDHPAGLPLRLQVGIADAVPKMVASVLLQPVLAIPERMILTCVEDTPERLLALLTTHEVDIIFADAPCTAHPRVNVLSHLLMRGPVVIVGTKEHARRYRKGFPRSLRGAPLLLPTPHANLHRSMEQWLSEHSITPKIMGEFDDQALLVELGQAGLGLFPVPAAIERTICSRFPVQRVGVITEVQESFYAITVERRISHPAVAAICKNHIHA
ncbi:MAG: transcriptional activator NhaR [Verrucomicrobia bacterium]|nr:transcriptional activator NhaR [Verrucomicrobiota bacterium]MBU4292197.1 transcriptional activator NhaR [Verrucomicrobiota bacterium]MBU4496416.1 transcriptional activator NhaR [Verrucomicrobiota bacterium]